MPFYCYLSNLVRTDESRDVVCGNLIVTPSDRFPKVARVA